jgi:hypothetical protein
MAGSVLVVVGVALAVHQGGRRRVAAAREST